MALNILVVRVSSLGDVVHNMPMISDMLRHFPDANIDWVVEEAYVDLVRLHTRVRNVIPFALRRWRKTLLAADTRAEIAAFHKALRKDQYDYVFDTQGLLKTALVMRAARLNPGGQRIGLANATEGSGYEGLSRIFHTRSVPVGVRTHAVERARVVAAAALGYSLDATVDFGWAAGEQHARPAWMPQHPFACFFHGTARAAKQWQETAWIELGKRLAENGLPVLLPWGSADEHERAQRLAQSIPMATVLPRLSMADAIALAAHTSLAVGVDTGLTHVAAAFTRPTIELYGDSPRWKTEAYWSPAIINLGEAGRMPDIEAVWDAAQQLLSAQSITFKQKPDLPQDQA